MKTLEEVLWKNTKNDGGLVKIGDDDVIGRMEVTCGQIMSCCNGGGGIGWWGGYEGHACNTCR